MRRTDVLLIGSGGREHALAWKLSTSPRIGKLYIAPGNGGTALLGENVDIGAMEFDKLAEFAMKYKIGLTIVGPDDPLAAGIVDEFARHRLRIWGPTKAAAQVEGSKAYAKQLMADAKIPTAAYRVFNSFAPAEAYVRAQGAPIVVKASGLALGKGVYVCATVEEALQALKAIIIDRVHKDAGNEVVIEQFLEGQEISIHAISDGINYALFPSSQDHKRALDGDEGQNTGGMGVIAPVPWVDGAMLNRIEREVVAPALSELGRRGTLFRGLLYPGIKMTVDGPKVLEFNARFGDPETQAYMRLLKSDLLGLIEASLDGRIAEVAPAVEWEHGFAVNIVAASGGYPGEYKKGLPITGIRDAERVEGVVVFHAGTKRDGNKLHTNGGRVLGVSAVGGSLELALKRAYEALGKIKSEGIQYRRDIGAKALQG